VVVGIGALRAIGLIERRKRSVSNGTVSTWSASLCAVTTTTQPDFAFGSRDTVPLATTSPTFAPSTMY
jgi:hypothetical protein